MPAPSPTQQSLLAAIASSLRQFAAETPPPEGHSLLTICADSLHATRLAAEIERVSGLAVDLRDLAETRSADELAQRLLDRDSGQAAAPFLARLADERKRNRSQLSFAQQRMAFMQGLAAGSAAYHVPFGLRIRGPLDTAALTRAVARLPEHYEVLRTCFVAAAEGTVCLPSPLRRLHVRLQDEPGASTAQLQQIASEFCSAPFDLERGEVVRAALIRADAADHLLVLVFHHIAIDQWSYELLLPRLAADYESLVTHRAASEPVADGYRDYSLRHRQWFREHGFPRERQYWLSRLDDAARTTFEPDRQRPPTPSYRGARVPLRLSEDRWLELEALARTNDATLAMLLFAATVLLLRNHCGSDDITLGVATASRHHPGGETAFGTLVNTLAIRTRVDDSVDFALLLRQVRERFVEALAHQDMPFDVLVKQLRPARDASVSPLFGVMFNMLNTPPARFALGDAQVERVEIDRRAAQFDVTLTIDRLHTRTIWFEYATDLYERQTLERIAGRFDELLRALPAMVHSPVALLPRDARAEALRAQAWGRGAPLRERGFALRGESPAQVMVVCEERVLTLAELDRESARFASGLAGLGLAPGDRVGLLVGRSVALPVTLLGALRAGVAFVPLDIGFPAERLEYMVSDAGLRVVVMDDGQARPRWLRADVAAHSLSEVVARAPDLRAMPDRDEELAAYVLYTSGSSGLPKGVEVSRRALFNLLASMRDVPGIRADDRLLAVTTLSFDISLLELLLPLTVGATVVIARRDQALDGLALIDLMERHAITVLQATPSTWLQLLEAGWQGDTRLRALVGGESLPPELARKLLPRVKELWNMYGPTETTIWSTCHRVSAVGGGPVPVGRPIANTVVAVIDANERPTGVGIVGEIVIGGDGVAAGYVGRSDLTAERFQRLDAVDPSVTFYRTGDLGRWNVHGQLECLGRRDSQIKMRGFRIEPGEIEAAAGQVAGVAQAVALAVHGGTSEARLLLFLLGDPAVHDLVDRVRARLRAHLPDYMQPQAIRVVGAMPRLPNGKIDRSVLARTSISAPPIERADPPRTGMEGVLGELWCELLELPVVGRDMDFFESGGHSLLAMRLVTRIRDEIGRQCSLAQVFQHPTIATLASALESARDADPRPLVPLRPDGDDTPLFCICGIRLYRALALQMPAGMPVLAVFVALERHRPDAVALARKYVEVIRSQQSHGPYRLLGFSFGGVLAFEIAQQLRGAGEHVEMLAILDSDVPGKRRLSSLRKARSALRNLSGTAARHEAAAPDYIVAMRDYEPVRYDGRLLFVRALRADQHDAGREWTDLATDAATAVIDTDHLGLLASPAVSSVARLLTEELARRAARPSAGG